MRKLSYDHTLFPFKQKFETILGMGLLEAINIQLDLLNREHDQITPIHPLFYQWARTDDFKELYTTFLLHHIKPLYAGEDIVYQTIPTFRISFPHNVAVGEFHKDKHYRDVEWAKKVREDNFFLPFTNAFDTNTVWVESEEDKGDFKPMNCDYGQCIRWDGSNLRHGNKTNETGSTRVSVDFRVMPLSHYIPSSQGSINTHTQFKIGAYYSRM